MPSPPLVDVYQEDVKSPFFHDVLHGLVALFVAQRIAAVNEAPDTK